MGTYFRPGMRRDGGWGSLVAAGRDLTTVERLVKVRLALLASNRRNPGILIL